MLRTNFMPPIHGYHFSNSDIKWEMHPGGPNGANLCGGMVYSALDHHYARKPIPKNSDPPPVRTPLNAHIYSRQVSAHFYTVPRLTRSTILFMFQQLYVDSVASEYDLIRRSIAANRPVPLFLIKLGAFEGHHVLVTACKSSPSLGGPILELYDPNNENTTTYIESHPAAKRFTISALKAEPYQIRGFFVDRGYRLKSPPDFPKPPPPGPSPGPSPGPLPPPNPPPLPSPVSRTHTVQRGENLSIISQKYYGTQSKWAVIYAANKAVIGNNPNLIKPGQMLTIPT
ncbi:MAG: hypothetical protein DCF30_22430 [Hyphomicrobiales bacterium]|nr:MAG: hypothetical protein DCF30_22430 [Hyphomicrobiales bacterium]